MDEETTSIKQEVRNERLTSLHNMLLIKEHLPLPRSKQTLNKSTISNTCYV